MKSVSASHLHYNRWNSLLPKGLAKLWIFNFNISMNIMNCFSKTKFSLLFHPIFLSFACFGMFHFRNSKFLNETGTSNKTSNFPNIFFRFRFFASLWVSLADCASASPMKAVSLAPRMRPSLGCLAASKQHPHPTSNPQNKTPLTVKSNYFRVARCSGSSFQADQFTAVSETSMKFGASMDDSIPKMVISVLSSWAIPMLFVGPILPHRQTALFGMEIIWYHQASTLCYMGWIPIDFGEFQVLMGENQKLDSSTQFLVGCIIFAFTMSQFDGFIVAIC